MRIVWNVGNNICNGQKFVDIPHGRYGLLVGTIWEFFGTTLGVRPYKMNNKNLGLYIKGFPKLHPTFNDD